MNIQLFEQIKAAIREEPKRLNMGDWIHLAYDDEPLRPACGTVCCIAGHALVLSAAAERAASTPEAIHAVATRVHDDIWSGELQGGFEDRAAELLGITEDQSNRLFFMNEWPSRLMDKFITENGYISPQTSKYAEVVCEVIDDFIATDGWQEEQKE